MRTVGHGARVYEVGSHEDYVATIKRLRELTTVGQPEPMIELRRYMDAGYPRLDLAVTCYDVLEDRIVKVEEPAMHMLGNVLGYIPQSAHEVIVARMKSCRAGVFCSLQERR